MSWLTGDWTRVVLVVGGVCAMTAFVWTKVQLSEAALASAAARDSLTVLREERSKLQAAVDLAQRPGVVSRRARTELRMVYPSPTRTRSLFVEARYRD